MSTYSPWPVWFSVLLALSMSLAGPRPAGGAESPGTDGTATDTGLTGKASAAGLSSAASAAGLLEQFARDWPDDRTTYRTEGDTSWMAYALTLRRLVALGDTAVPELLAACNDPHSQVRALSARVLGLLGDKSTATKSASGQSIVATLIALLDDSSPQVALMAADALGQIQDPRGLEALGEARQRIDHGDVLLHINKGLQRQVPLEEDVRAQVLRIKIEQGNGEPDQVNAATVGQPAPDFTLRDSTGKAWRLADFRGHKSVLLVFIYGDG